MAHMNIRYLVRRPGPSGGLDRWFWQPSSLLRAQGWRPQRVPLNWDAFHDPVALEGAAITRAQELNAELDAARGVAALEAARAPTPPAQRTVGDLITHYKQSDDWTSLRPKTHRGYLQCLARIETWCADAPVRSITAVQVRRLMDSMKHTPSFMNAVARVLRLLLEHGRRHGFVTVNPALRPGLAGTEPTGLIWPREAIPLFVAAADRLGRHSIGTAVLVNEWLGQREGDILRMPWHVLRNGTLWVKQSKTGAGVGLPVGMVDHLVRRLEEERGRQLARAGNSRPIPATIIVDEHTGLPFKEDRFRHVFADVRAAAAKDVPEGFEVDFLMPGRDMMDPRAFIVRMEQLTFMALRHTGVTRLAEAECDNSLIASITGHSETSVDGIIRRYKVRTAKVARLAFQRRLDAEGLGASVDSVRGAGA